MIMDYVIASSDGSYHFFPISETMEKNNFDLEQFTYPVYNEGHSPLLQSVVAPLSKLQAVNLHEPSQAETAYDVRESAKLQCRIAQELHRFYHIERRRHTK